MRVLPRTALGFFLLSQSAFCGFAQYGIITTYAGPSLPENGAQAVTQAIDQPGAVAADGDGGFYVSSMHQNRIYRVAANGSIRLTAGIGAPGFSGDGRPATAAQLNHPTGVAVDTEGNLYIADFGNHRVRKVSTEGVIGTVAGNGTDGFSGDGGPATAAQICSPIGVAVDSEGALYIADAGNHRIRKVTTAGIISTVAGNGSNGIGGDGGPALAAQLQGPNYISVDSEGNLYIADTGNNRIRKVTPAGIIGTVAGKGYLGHGGYSGDDGPATAAQLLMPRGLSVDSKGNLYIADYMNHRIRKLTPAGVISTMAGSGRQGYGGDGGPATKAQLNYPMGVSVDSADNVYIADCDNHRIRKVTTAGIISTVAGYGDSRLGDGGPAATAQLQAADGVAVDSEGNLYIADCVSHRIRKVTTSGIISTVAGNGTEGYSGDGGPATEAQLRMPKGVAVDSESNLYIVDYDNNRIRKVTPAGVISTVAGNGSRGYSGDEGPGTKARLNDPMGVAVDTEGNLYIADYGNNRVRKVTPTGIISTVAGNGTEGYSGDEGLATAAQLHMPHGVAVDSEGNLYIADFGNDRIRKVTPAGSISTVAGNGTAGYNGDGNLATMLQLDRPMGVAVDSVGNLYIADWGDHRIRKVTTAGIISTVAGNGAEGYSGDGGPATAAHLYRPHGVAIDYEGNLYIADAGNHRIRKVSP